jgi:flagellar motor switch/type III secretory pathway protein FliN
MSPMAEFASILLKATGQFVAKHADQALISVAAFVESLEILIPQGLLDDIGKMKARAHRRDAARTAEKEAAAQMQLREVVREDSDRELERLERTERVERDREESRRQDARVQAEVTKMQSEALKDVASAMSQLRVEGGSAAVDLEQLRGLLAGSQSPPDEADESGATEDQS